MARWLWGIVALGAAGAARADDAVIFGPAPSWVVPVVAPPAAADASGLDVRLLDYQTRVDAQGVHQYGHQIYRLNSPAAVQAVGTVGVTWQPAYGGATINELVIRRGGERIDVLKSGATFNVIRREAALEAAFQLNGILTAVLQVPDLRVGDELELGFTIDSRIAAFADHGEAEDFVRSAAPIDRLYVRYSWPQQRPVRWRVGARLPPVRREDKDGVTAILVSGDNVKPPAVIPGAPTRFLDEGAVQVTEFASWREVAETVAPLFANASQIAPDSPLNAEIARIAAASPDPAARAAMALQLVQSQVRYFARLDGLGGFVRESADAVWRARSGDCKGKSVLLLALLKGLGVEAEPALVSSVRGDGLDKALPLASRFDHVLVRATIGGKIYWLDGARAGDRALDQLATPPFKWALPLGSSHRALEALRSGEPAAPTDEWRLDLDARAGVDTPAKARGEAIFRGDRAIAFRVAASLLTHDALDAQLHKLWQDRHDWLTVDKVTYQDDAAADEVRIGFEGSGKMDWDAGGLTATNRYEADKSRLGVDLAPKRDADVAELAPVLVNARNEVTHETILLPDGGKDFSLEGEAVDQTIGGVHYERTMSLRDGRFDLTAITRSAEGEISYADAQAADRKTDELFNRQVFIHRPWAAGLKTVSLGPTLPAPTPLALGATLAPILALASQGKPEVALAELDKLKLDDAQKADAAGVRGTVLAQLNRRAEADQAFDQALAIDRADAIALLGKTKLLLTRGDAEDALILADRLVLVAPEKSESYQMRGYVRRALNNPQGALADWEIAVEKGTANEQLLQDRVSLLYGSGDRAKALTEADALVRQRPQSARAYALQADILGLLGRREEAAKAAARSLQIAPTPEAYRVRLRHDLSGDSAATLADMLVMIRLQPNQPVPIGALRRVVGLPDARRQLEAAYDRANSTDPETAEEIAIAREEVAAAAGEPQKLLARHDALTAAHPNDAPALNNACWARATLGVQLEKALADCNAAIKLAPTAMHLDSRGLVRLRLKAYTEAISDYDAALKLDPTQSGSLYGRGLAKIRAGDRTGGEADLAAARKLSPDVAEEFAEMGLDP